MRILDSDRNAPCANVTLYLRHSEAWELLSSLKALLENAENANHLHVPADDFSAELTVCIYDPAKLDGFDGRSKRLILENQ